MTTETTTEHSVTALASKQAAQLRRAARLVEMRAGGTTPAPWRYVPNGGLREDSREPDQPSAYGPADEWVAECGPDADDDALWIAMFGPQVGAPLAELFTVFARSVEEGMPAPRVLALADAILNGGDR